MDGAAVVRVDPGGAEFGRQDEGCFPCKAAERDIKMADGSDRIGDQESFSTTSISTKSEERDAPRFAP